MAIDKHYKINEQMFYVLISLVKECVGSDIIRVVENHSGGRVIIGPVTLFNMLEAFLRDSIIEKTKDKSYILTDLGRELLTKEYEKISILKNDYEKIMEEVCYEK